MRWPFRKSNATLAAQVPDGGLHRYLATPQPPGDATVDDVGLLALDFETTGLDAARDQIVSAGMVDVDGLTIPLGTATNILVNPGRDVGQSAVIHQLTDDKLVATGVSLTEALDQVFDRLAGRVLLAHHCAIEVGLLTAAVRRAHGIQIDIPAVDTLTLGHRALGMDDDHPPDALRLWRLRRRSSLPTYRGHDAVVDALACAELWLALAQELRIGTLRQALRWS